LSRNVPGPDSAYSIEAREFKEMVEAVRLAERALGRVRFGPSAGEAATLAHRRSLYVVQNVKRGELFTPENVRSIRPANGMHTRHLNKILGRRAAQDIERGTPLMWELVAPQ
jgi:pseudaminic acid synthase